MNHVESGLVQAVAAVRPQPAYRVRLAESGSDLEAAQALRFAVFNLELDEGLAQSYDTGLDADPFDAHCAHLIVEDEVHGGVVGTYRLQTGVRAAGALGYYCEREFDLTPFEPARSQILELGRACIDGRHRNFMVLNLLWKAIASYAREHGARYLIGCSSLTTQDSAVAAAAFQKLAPHMAPLVWRTVPTTRFACPGAIAATAPVKIPRLLAAYLGLGAAICGPPALDREFGTVDFLTWLDIESPAMLALQRRGRFVA